MWAFSSGSRMSPRAAIVFILPKGGPNRISRGIGSRVVRAQPFGGSYCVSERGCAVVGFFVRRGRE